MARAQTYPNRPVRLIVGAPPGGPNDVHARLIGQWLSERLGQPFIVENRAGAGTNLGTEVVVRAPADGYTLLFASSPNAINATLYRNLNFDFLRDIAPVAGMSRGRLVMAVNPSFPAKTVPDFINYAKANPNKISMASAGNGTPQHVAGELFKMMAGVQMIHVPYRGEAPALTDLIGGQVQMMFGTIVGLLGYFRAGTVHPLAVTSAARSDALPDVPTVGDFISGYEVTTWGGIVAPKGTPSEIIEKLNAAIIAGLASPGLKARYADLGVTASPGTPEEFGKFITHDTEKWAKVIKFSGAKVD
jgi:tripartite-type tricarboxylate transporter receptor subunit TctC